MKQYQKKNLHSGQCWIGGSNSISFFLLFMFYQSLRHCRILSQGIVMFKPGLNRCSGGVRTEKKIGCARLVLLLFFFSSIGDEVGLFAHPHLLLMLWAPSNQTKKSLDDQIWFWDCAFMWTMPSPTAQWEMCWSFFFLIFFCLMGLLLTKKNPP